MSSVNKLNLSSNNIRDFGVVTGRTVSSAFKKIPKHVYDILDNEGNQGSASIEVCKKENGLWYILWILKK